MLKVETEGSVFSALPDTHTVTVYPNFHARIGPRLPYFRTHRRSIVRPMAAEAAPSHRLRESVLGMTKAEQERGTDPLIWAIQLSSILAAAGVSVPAVEVAEILVSHICWSNNAPIAWKFLDKALSMGIVPPFLVLAHLSTRVIQVRRRQPVAYRLYLELTKRYAFSLSSLIRAPNYQKIMKSIDEIFQFNQIFGVQSSEPGLLLVEFMFATVWELLDASLDDEGLLELTPEKKSRWLINSQDMEAEYPECFDTKIMDREAALNKTNTIMSIEIIIEFFRNKVTSQILVLAHRNMPIHWECFIRNLRLLAGNSSAVRRMKCISSEELLQLTPDTCQVLSRQCKTTSQQQFCAVTALSPISYASQCQGTAGSALWLPIDLYLENKMNQSEVAVTSAVETLTDLLKGLQSINQTDWQEAFLGLWIAALRLVQRESNSIEGPVPRLDTCLCMLLSIATLAVANIVEEEDIRLREGKQSSLGKRKNKKGEGKHREDLVASLHRLDDFEGLLTAPPPVVSLANLAAIKAYMFALGHTVGIGNLDDINLNDIPLDCPGNLRHLIVEACISRNVLDTSAYLWPGYVKSRCNQIPQSSTGQVPGWSSLMKGSPLTPPMVAVLVSTPAMSLAEIERIYEIAISGLEHEKISAATILCGASLTRGWNIQEHVGMMIIRLLSPVVPTDISRSGSHLIDHAPVLNVLLVGISLIDSTMIFSLLGLVPQLAAALMPICEVFGSHPLMSCSLNTEEEISSHVVFSNAFTLLLKLWRFHKPPVEMGDVRTHLTPEYILLVRNSQLSSFEKAPKNQKTNNKLPRFSHAFSREPLFMDSFPKLKSWYRQHQQCIASTLSGLVPETLVHQIVEALLNMMFRKNDSSSVSATNDSSPCLKLPAWDILEAVPFVLDAALTACVHGTLLPRDLTTGLKDLADFLPASLATISSYFSAEVNRGLWKPACMNGTDWPSPAANLHMVEEQIKKLLAATGVNVPSLTVGESSSLTLPLPLAALVSLTIVYKSEKSTRFLNLVAPALRNLGVGCPWPCMPIIAALWTQKVKRWSEFFIFSASQTAFHHNNDAVIQILKVCFTTALSLKNSSSIASNSSVGALLGHGIIGGTSAVAPGILYLRVHEAIRDVKFITEEIVSLLMQSVKDILNSGLPSDITEKLKKTKYNRKYGGISLPAAMARVKVAASLGASFLWLTGGLISIQSLINEVLPSWFLLVHGSEANQSGGLVDLLGGYALAYLVVFSGMFAWGIDSGSSKNRPKVIGKHLEFVANALDDKVSLGCSKRMWRAYVVGILNLVVSCIPNWVLELDVEVVKRVCKGLRHWNERELAVEILGICGIGGVATAAEMIIETGI